MAVEERTWVGKSVKRREDPRILAGRGTYVDDIKLPGLLHAAVLRSPPRTRASRASIRVRPGAPQVSLPC